MVNMDGRHTKMPSLERGSLCSPGDSMPWGPQLSEVTLPFTTQTALWDYWRKMVTPLRAVLFSVI